MKLNELLPDIHVEDYTNEFKARLLLGVDKQKEDNELKWLKEIVAFSNTQGGMLYVGVNDKTLELEPMNHREIDETVRNVYQKTEERIEPEITLTMKEIPLGNEYPDKYILQISIPKSKTTPVYVHANGIPACYIRQFGRAKIASPEQIAQLVIQSTRISYDATFTNKTYHPESFRKLITKYTSANHKTALSDKVLESIGFIDENNHLSKGALLFEDSCKDPITLAKCSLFPGFDKSGDIISASESYQGCLLDVIQKVLTFIENHSANGFQKTDTSRVDYFSFPKRALFEGIINAFAHRNYFIFGAEIQFDIFPDRLEITSPGSLLGGKNLEQEKNIGKIQPKRRNEVICHIFELLHMMEAKGTGFDKIVEDYASAKDTQKPFISCDDDSFTLTLPDLTFAKGVVSNSNPYPDIHLLREIISPYDEKILSCCYQKGRTILEIASYLGISSSTHLRKDILEKLVTEGYLFKTQKGKAYFYQTNKGKLSFVS